MSALPAFLKKFRKKVWRSAVCREEKTLRWFTAFAILVFWGIKIVYNDVYIDSEVMSIEPNGLIQSWYGHKRYGLILMKKLVFYVRLVPYLSNLLFAAVLWGVILLLCFSVKRWFALELSGGSKWSLYLMAALFVSCPSLAEQYMFTLQAFEITLAMGFCLIAAYSADQAICEGKSFLWYAPALFFLVWSLGAYQSFCPFISPWCCSRSWAATNAAETNGRFAPASSILPCSFWALFPIPWWGTRCAC